MSHLVHKPMLMSGSAGLLGLEVYRAMLRAP